MSYHDVEGLRYFTFDGLDDLNVDHAIITRRGGVSRAPYESLNLGGTVGDDPSRVRQNQRLVMSALELPDESIYDVWQVHGDVVVSTDGPRPNDQPHQQADATLTDRPGVTLLMRFADCVPILLYDPIKSVVGIAHAGWKGTVLRTAAQAVVAMQEKYESHPADLWAGIGPSIGPHHYEVGAQVESEVLGAFGQDASELLNSPNGKGQGVQFDLWTANQIVLSQAGVRNIEISGVCTACDLDNWYSHRDEGGTTGRFGALITL